MKTGFLAVAAMCLASSAAVADQYACTVHCLGPDGKTQIVVKAGSAAAAARAVDRQSDRICRSAGHRKSTSASMSAAQCARK